MADTPPEALGAFTGLTGSVVRLLVYGNGSWKRSLAILLCGVIAGWGAGAYTGQAGLAILIGLLAGVFSLFVIEAAARIMGSHESQISDVVGARIDKYRPAPNPPLPSIPGPAPSPTTPTPPAAGV